MRNSPQPTYLLTGASQRCVPPPSQAIQATCNWNAGTYLQAPRSWLADEKHSPRFESSVAFSCCPLESRCWWPAHGNPRSQAIRQAARLGISRHPGRLERVFLLRGQGRTERTRDHAGLHNHEDPERSRCRCRWPEATGLPWPGPDVAARRAM